ncbi:MAG TPA: hypothetical protein VF950_00990 [Planctomycetota bacterium]
MRDSGDAVPYLAWLAFLGAAAALLLADPLPFVTPGHLHGILVAAEVAFVLLAWPFLEKGRGRTAARSALLAALALPIALLAENISAAGGGALIRGQVLVFALAALVSALRAGDSRRAPAYLLVVALLGAGLPLAAFVAQEFGGRDLGWLADFSPVWAALRGTGLLLTALAAAAAALLMAVDRPEPAA